jgi:putative two-component system response regulator
MLTETPFTRSPSIPFPMTDHSFSSTSGVYTSLDKVYSSPKPFTPYQENFVSGAVILVVEDNDVLRQGVQLLLEGDGFRVLSASNGVHALEHMESISPDLILSDISMPEMDGYALFDAVRARAEWVTIPFIFLTARGGQDDVFAGKKLGAEDYLIKPVNRQELITTVRSRLARSQELLLAQLQQAYEASLIMLSSAIELRDRYTRGHVERVRDYSTILGQQMGLNPVHINTLQFGSILHDIGKIYISENILLKPGQLNEEEWAEMRKHPVVGADLLQNIPYLSSAVPIIRHHHERWDGEGYPDGLAGEEIPLLARVVALVDSLDAMTTTRVYQPPCTPDQAYRDILNSSGSHYDPQIVEVFASSWDMIQTRMRSQAGLH